MQIESLKVFCDLVDTASFSLAAQRNGITQSAVSQQIRALETRYGVSFFERAKKNFSVTTEGQIFEGAAREIMEVFAGIEENLNALRDVVSGNLRIASVYSVGLHQLPAVVEQFRESFPEVNLEVSYHSADDVYSEVEEGRCDIGIVAYPKPRGGLAVEVVAEEKLVVIVTPESELAGRKRIRLEDLSGSKFIAFSSGVPSRKGIDKLFRDAGSSVDPVLAFGEVETVKRAVVVESAVAIVPESSVAHEVETGLLVKIAISGVEAVRPIGVVKKRSRVTTPALREFLAFLPSIV